MLPLCQSTKALYSATYVVKVLHLAHAALTPLAAQVMRNAALFWASQALI